MRFRWVEVQSGGDGPVNFMLATSTDHEVAANAGEGAGAVVAAASQALTAASMNFAIRSNRERMSRDLPALFGNHRRGGMLVIATVDNTQVGELGGQRFVSMEIHNGVYAQPHHAIYAWQRRPRLSGIYGRASYRYWWITRLS